MPEEYKDKPVSDMVVQCNRAYLNSKIWEGGKSDKAPFVCYLSWTIPTKSRNSDRTRDYNSIKLVYFPEDRNNHPLQNAEKGDIIRFPVGRLQLSTQATEVKGEKKELLNYAEVVVYRDLNVERASNKDNANNNEQKSEPAAEQKSEPAAEQKSEPAAEQKSEPAAEQKSEPAAEQKSEPAAEQKSEPAAEQKQESSDTPAAGEKSPI